MSDGADERYRRAQAIVHDLLERGPGQRAVAIEAACGADAALRREVDWLLASVDGTLVEGRAGALLDGGAASIAGTLLADGRLESVAPSRYRLIERIGEGGMGQVWMAEREQGRARQLVALKLLRGTGAIDEAALARFLEEGRILAALNHPNIAHLVEAAQGADGVPFLAMEYVDGRPVDRWCEVNNANVRSRVELFVKVCTAVEYAHAHLVIHRDIKPANILVNAAGEPKLLDFGIARLLDADREGTRAVTATRAMTLAYASPEQIEGRRLGTATDVYSLGVVLFELLAGRRPFDHLDTDHARSNAIVSGDVAPPSEILRRTDPDARRRATPRRIPADLDAIVMKALRREPNQRYSSVADFADDLRAFLASRPVQARRGRTGYRVRRFVWRNRWLLAVASLVVVLASGFTWRTVLAEREALTQAAISDRVSQFLVSVFAASDSNVNMTLTHELTAGEVLDNGAARIDAELADQPRIRARLYEAIGNAYRHMNANAKGVALLRKAADIHLDPSIDQPLDAARVLEAMANAMANGQFPARDAEAAARESLDLAQRLTAPGSQQIANAWMVLSLALNRGGNLVAAEQAARTTYAMNEELGDGKDNRFVAANANLCIILVNRGLLDAAEPYCRRSLEMRLSEGRQIVLAMTQSRFAQWLAAAGDLDGALVASDDAIALARELKGDVSAFGTAFTLRRAVILDDAGRHEEARPLFEKVSADALAVDGSGSGEYLEARVQFARHQARSGRPAAAVAALRELVPVVTARYGSDDPRSLVVRTVLAQALLDSGVADAHVRGLLDEASAGWNAKDDPDAVQPCYTRLAMAQWYSMNGETGAARTLLDRLEAPGSRADRVVRAGAAALRTRLPP
ncbi:MAG: serine/threonine protein kinase [Xanthomonadales bacterium]|nr:serine/threonine protein kinase [Xanthomonadales bacterium]